MANTIINFPSFADQEYRPYEMRALVQALELRFRSIEQESSAEEVTGDYAALVHSHTESDITDLQSYLTSLNSESIFDLSDVSGSPVNNDILVWNAGTNRFELTSFTLTGSALGSLTDVDVAGAAVGEVLTFDGADWVASAASGSGFGTQDEFMVVDGLGTTFSLWWGASLQRLEMYNVATATTGGFWLNFQAAHAEPSIRIGQAGDTDFQFQTDAGQHIYNGLYLRIYDSTDADYAQFSHDGTDFNAAFTGTTDWNITGLTAIQAGTVDVDFDAITATSYGGILEANLLDKVAAETVTGDWIFSGLLTAPVATVTAHEAAIDHDALLNFVAAEHIDWSVTGAEDVHADRIAANVKKSFFPITTTSSSSDTVWSTVTASNVTVVAGKTYHIVWNLRTYSAAATTGLALRRALKE